MTLGFVTQRASDSQLRALLELVTRENTAFFLDRIRQGQETPSTSEAAVRYCPDQAAHEVMLLDAATLLDQGVGSCGSLAVYEAGLRRALAQSNGTPAAVASGRFGPVVIPRPNHQGVDYWHAVVRTPSGLFDPSRHLQQVCVTPSYA